MPAPLVMTLTLDADDQGRFDDLRRAHFPADRNHLGAHVTLFHALPGQRLDEVATVAQETAAGCQPFEVAVTGVRLLGRGVAYDLAAPELAALHARLAERFAGMLTRQDRQRLHAHVTVQNKVDPEVARALHADLAGGFAPWRAGALGLDLWWYEGGPWRHERQLPFDPTAAVTGAAPEGR